MKSLVCFLVLCLVSLSSGQEYFEPDATLEIGLSPALKSQSPAQGVTDRVNPTPQDKEGTKQSPWQRASVVFQSLYGQDLEADLMEQVINSFVLSAARSDKAAPVTGTREEKAAYYLLLLRSVHKETYLRDQGQRAADKRIEELKSKLPQ